MSLAAASTFLGVVAGWIIAKYVPDETEWYQKFFLIGGITFAIFAGLLSGWIGIILAIAFGYTLWQERIWLLMIVSSALAVSGGVLAWEMLFIALMIGTGYLYSRGARKQLLWFVLMPIIIMAVSFLS